MTKKEAAEAVRAAKARLKVTWAQLGEAVDRPLAWTTAALLGQHLQVYGSTIKELIHDQFDDSIMSAINFRLDVARGPDLAGDRVVVTLDGKFLPYQW